MFLGLGQSTRAWRCVLANLKNAKKKKRAYLLLETEDACSADGFLPTASLYLPSALTCLHVPFVFSAAFEAEKVMKRPTYFELVLILCLSLSAGTKAMAKPILLSVLLLYISFSFLRFFFCFILWFFYPFVLCRLSFFLFFSLVCEFML